MKLSERTKSRIWIIIFIVSTALFVIGIILEPFINEKIALIIAITGFIGFIANILMIFIPFFVALWKGEITDEN